MSKEDTTKPSPKKSVTITVRWYDGFKRDFHPVDYQFGSDYLWMKFDNGKEEWIPIRQVRNIKTVW